MNAMHKQLIIGIILMVLGAIMSILDNIFVKGNFFGWILGLGILMIVIGYIFIAGASMFPPVTE
jgi:hypothetical protein